MALTLEQLQARTEWIGSSDVPAILGVDGYKNIGDLWLAKTKRAQPEVTTNPAADWGDRLEPVICEWLGERVGEEVVRGEHRQSDDGLLRAQLDGWLPALGETVEVKTSGLFSPMFRAETDGWGEGGADEVPFRVIAQVQFALLITSAPRGHVAAFLGNGIGPRHYVLEANPDLQDVIEERCRAFWNDHVLADTPPEEVPHIETLRTVAREAGKSVEVDAELIERYKDTLDQLALVKPAHEERKAALIAALADAEEGYSLAGNVTYRANKNGTRALRLKETP